MQNKLTLLSLGPQQLPVRQGGSTTRIFPKLERVLGAQPEESNGFQIVSSVAFFSLLVPHFPRANDIRNDVLCAIILVEGVIIIIMVIN